MSINIAIRITPEHFKTLKDNNLLSDDALYVVTQSDDKIGIVTPTESYIMTTIDGFEKETKEVKSGSLKRSQESGAQESGIEEISAKFDTLNQKVLIELVINKRELTITIPLPNEVRIVDAAKGIGEMDIKNPDTKLNNTVDVDEEEVK